MIYYNPETKAVVIVDNDTESTAAVNAQLRDRGFIKADTVLPIGNGTNAPAREWFKRQPLTLSAKAMELAYAMQRVENILAEVKNNENILQH